MDIKKYIKECHDIAISKGFYECPDCKKNHTAKVDGIRDVTFINKYCPECLGTGINQNRNIGEILMLIVSELSEALEVHRNNKFANMIDFNIVRTEEWTRLNSKLFENHIKDTFEDELADVFIRLFDLCGYLKIDENIILPKENTWFITHNVAEILFKIVKNVIHIDNSLIPYMDIYRVIRDLYGLCLKLNIPIEKHIIAKMEYNKIRPYKHNKEY